MDAEERFDIARSRHWQRFVNSTRKINEANEMFTIEIDLVSFRSRNLRSSSAYCDFHCDSVDIRLLSDVLYLGKGLELLSSVLLFLHLTEVQLRAIQNTIWLQHDWTR